MEGAVSQEFVLDYPSWRFRDTFAFTSVFLVASLPAMAVDRVHRHSAAAWILLAGAFLVAILFGRIASTRVTFGRERLIVRMMGHLSTPRAVGYGDVARVLRMRRPVGHRYYLMLKDGSSLALGPFRLSSYVLRSPLPASFDSEMRNRFPHLEAA